MTRVKALIAGGGIGGLAAGLSLRRVGLDVQVLERSSEVREIGAALLLWPNGMHALQSLGVEPRTLSVCKHSMRTWRGAGLLEAPVDRLRTRYGCGMEFVHRADLQAALLRALGLDELRLNAEVTGFVDRPGTVEVRLKSGECVEGDLLVGADGLRSSVRRQLLGDGDPIYMGATIWRAVVDADGIPIEPGQGINWVGRGAEFLAFHLADRRIYWAGVTKEPEGARAGPDGHKGDLAERFGAWQQPIPELIAATGEDTILRNDMYDRPPVRSWSRGRVTLLGDAAHPMTPNAGQGACLALEDAVALAECIAQRSELREAFELYESRRLRHTNRIVKVSHQTSRAVQVENPVLCALRDFSSRLMLPSVQLRVLDSMVGFRGQDSPAN